MPGGRAQHEQDKINRPKNHQPPEAQTSYLAPPSRRHSLGLASIVGSDALCQAQTSSLSCSIVSLRDAAEASAVSAAPQWGLRQVPERNLRVTQSVFTLPLCRAQPSVGHEKDMSVPGCTAGPAHGRHRRNTQLLQPRANYLQTQEQQRPRWMADAGYSLCLSPTPKLPAEIGCLVCHNGCCRGAAASRLARTKKKDWRRTLQKIVDSFVSVFLRVPHEETKRDRAGRAGEVRSKFGTHLERSQQPRVPDRAKKQALSIKPAQQQAGVIFNQASDPNSDTRVVIPPHPKPAACSLPSPKLPN